jgi:hypothetical protein
MKPFPKGPIPPQPEFEDHPPMDWPKGKAWPPTKEEWDRRNEFLVPEKPRDPFGIPS